MPTTLPWRSASNPQSPDIDTPIREVSKSPAGRPDHSPITPPPPPARSEQSLETLSNKSPKAKCELENLLSELQQLRERQASACRVEAAANNVREARARAARLKLVGWWLGELVAVVVFVQGLRESGRKLGVVAVGVVLALSYFKTRARADDHSAHLLSPRSTQLEAKIRQHRADESS
eukprot:TRINITY_DN3499_c0_g1_i2.p1 TRINITY_DN3499_c0_g1~~TRINITY_DN3499_c0_g1_i2.p1  ORF type:complete len:178 (-),score=31.54 TRINITY_DN3499_c0_g1_i2:206-739(-)